MKRILHWFFCLRWWWKLLIAPLLTAFLAALLALAIVFILLPVTERIRWLFLSPEERVLFEADALSKKANWRAADPLYRMAEQMFRERGNLAMELYANASQIPAKTEASTEPLEFWLNEINRDLTLPQAQSPRTRMRLLEIKGQIENNYDATLAYNTWRTVEQLAGERHEWTVANRAYGEEAIGLFLLGQTAEARKHAFASYGRALILRDREGRMRLASLIGSGMVQFQVYEDALPFLDSVIATAKATPNAAYPNVAVTAKVDALRGLKRYSEALSLCTEAMRVPERDHLKGHLYQILTTRAGIWEDEGDLTKAAQDYAQAFEYARQLGYWRGLTETGGPLAQIYEEEDRLAEALSIINEALAAQKRIPSEMYFAPRNLAIRAEILRRLGRVAESNNLYERSLALVDSLLMTAPTPLIMHRILQGYSRAYSGYFSSLVLQHRLPEALGVIERAHGRIEQIALQSRRHLEPHPPTPDERELTALNIRLISTEDEGRREKVLSGISSIESKLDSDPWGHSVVTRPVPLADLQHEIHPGELLIEYVLGNPRSQALAITAHSVTRYVLPSRTDIETSTQQYLARLSRQEADDRLAKRLFQQLLAPITEFQSHQSVIIVPDGDLHLLPFSALQNGSQFVIATHTTSVVSAATVLHMLRSRGAAICRNPFMGFAPWADEDERYPRRAFSVLSAWRGATGPRKSEFVPLPESKYEVLTGRNEVDKLQGAAPSKDQIKIGLAATEAAFKRLALADYQVLHLSVHGYADFEHPDRSALVFAQGPRDQGEDGLLQIREIRQLRLSSSLVVLSACKTGLGPADEGGVASVANAFLQAGAQTTVSSFWPVSDHASRQFMTEFYAHLAMKESKGEAMRNAADTLRRTGLPPYYWAAFELSGDADGTLSTRK